LTEDEPKAERPAEPPLAQARITPGTVDEIGQINMFIARLAGLGLGVASPDLFTTLGRHRGLFRRWLWFAGGLMPGGRLPRADTELIILRTAHNCQSEYERQAHKQLALTAGLTARQIEHVPVGASAASFSSHQRLLLHATDELHANRRLSDAIWAQLRTCYDDARMIEFCMLVGHYEMLAMTLNSLGVQPDDGLAEPPRRGTRLLQRIAGHGRPASGRIT
jgi:alkylhydroperoxidase family enzyme